MANRVYTHTGNMSKQFTTAGSAIALSTTYRPLYNSAAPEEQAPTEVIITGITTNPSDLVVTSIAGVDDTWSIAEAQLPFVVPLQIKTIKATSTADIIGNAVYS